MRNVIAEVAQRQAQAAVRRAVVPAAWLRRPGFLSFCARRAVRSAVLSCGTDLRPALRGADHRGSSLRPRSRRGAVSWGQATAKACAAARHDAAATRDAVGASRALGRPKAGRICGSTACAGYRADVARLLDRQEVTRGGLFDEIVLVDLPHFVDVLDPDSYPVANHQARKFLFVDENHAL
jgi:hypothetical protein